jgi:hypothetical protein
MKYDVHIYATVRVKVCGVEANSQKEAIKKAEAQTDLYETLGESGHGTEYAEEITGFLVDEEGDTEYQQTRSYNGKGNQLRNRKTRASGEKRTV